MYWDDVPCHLYVLSILPLAAQCVCGRKRMRQGASDAFYICVISCVSVCVCVCLVETVSEQIV